jgi:predicted nucleic acid-binding protein
MRIYMDNCCFNRPFDDQASIRIRLETEAKLYIQEKIMNKEIELAWSYIIDYENEFNPFEERRNTIDKWRSHAAIDIGQTADIINNAESIQKLGVKSKDALHVACAIEAKCDYFFSTDDILLKKLSEFDKIKVLNPLSFLTVLEGSQ